MGISRLASFQLLCCALLIGCRTSVAGHYGLDLEETKRAVEKVAAESPEDAKMKDGALKMLTATKLDVELAEDGKMKTTTVLELGPQSGKQSLDGTWKLDGKRVVVKVAGENDTLCDVDGARLRCAKDVPYKLFGRYVLVKK